MILPLQLVERRLRIDREAIRRYADITQDFNPIHLDPEFAAKTRMGGIIAHGMLSLSLIWQALAATFGQERMADIAMDIRFARPVRENDLVIAGGTRIGEHASYDVWIRAEGQDRTEIVISGTVTVGTGSSSTERATV